MGCAALVLCMAVPGARVYGQDEASEAARRAVELGKKGDYNGAAAEFTKAIKASPKTGKALQQSRQSLPRGRQTSGSGG